MAAAKNGKTEYDGRSSGAMLSVMLPAYYNIGNKCWLPCHV